MDLYDFLCKDVFGGPSFACQLIQESSADSVFDE